MTYYVRLQRADSES